MQFNPDTIGVAQAVITTLGAVLIVGLAFLPHPSRATVLWSVGFILSAVFVILSVFATFEHIEPLRRAALAGMMSTTVFPWAGLRAWRGVHPYAWLFLPTLAVLVPLLVLPNSNAAYGVCFRIAFLITAVYPGLAAWELLRKRERRDLLLQPILIGSLAFVAFAIGSGIAGFFFR